MPTYEYECRKCGKRFEVFQQITERPKSRCPACRGSVRRLLGGGAGLLFKGSGFYITDYRSDSYKSAAKSEKAAPAPTASESKKTEKATPAPPASGGKGKTKSSKAG